MLAVYVILWLPVQRCIVHTVYTKLTLHIIKIFIVKPFGYRLSNTLSACELNNLHTITWIFH